MDELNNTGGSSGKRALVIGATGLVGTELVRQLVEDPVYGGITTLTRRLLPLENPKLRQVQADFASLDRYGEEFEGIDAVFCCLGTTMRTAGSKEAFRRVDLEYPVETVHLARRAGVRQFAVISAMGASESSLFFYNRVKGEMERMVQEAGLPAVYVFRPSLLMGDRQEHRPGEAAAERISSALPFLWSGPLRKYKPVHVRTVAAAMRAAVRKGARGVHVYENLQLEDLADSTLG